MSTRGTQLDPPPEKGIAIGEFFHREENPFRDLDETKQPTITEAEEELETNDVQFKALKQDVLLQMFESGLKDDKTFPSSGNLFAIGNRTGYFACGRQNGFIYGKTELLRTAFEESKPKTTATLKNALNIDLPETPTHVRLASDEKSIVIAMPSHGVVMLECDQLQQKKSVTEATKCSLTIPPVLDIVPNPSVQHANHLAYISRTFADSPYGNLFLFDISSQKSQQLDSQREYTCLTFSHEGDILMACTRSGEALYYNLSELGKAPIRRPSPVGLPEPEGETWWIIQGVHWIDTWNQLVIYNPLTHPSDPPTHDYQAYIISNPSRLSNLSAFNFEFIKLSLSPVDAFGNTSLRPWFWFQALHNWKPEIQDLVICSVTAGSDIGLLGRGNKEAESSKGWRIWTIEDENRRATIPYNMEKNEETIVAGMQLDFTATKKLEKPLYPDEQPVECDPLPILWVLNTSGQLAGWTVMYIPGIKAGERPVSMMPVDWQDQYWQQKTQRRLESVQQIDEGEKRDRELWEKEWQAKSSNKEAAPASIQESPQKPAQPPVEQVQTPAQTPIKPTPAIPPPVLTPPSQPSSNEQPVHPGFGKQSPLGVSTFGQTGQLGGTLPGLSSIYPGIASGSRPMHVFGQSTGLAPFGSSTPGSMSSGFAKYSSQPGQGSSFLSGPSQAGSFLQNAKGGSFLSGEQRSSFLQSGQESGFAKAGQDQGFGKYSSSRGFGTPQSMTTPSSFSDGGFLASRSESSPSSPFGGSPKNSLSQRTQSLTSPTSRTQSYDMLDDSDIESDKSTGVESESDEDNSVRVDALNFGDEGFNLDLDGKGVKNTGQPFTPVKNEGPSQTIIGRPTESPSSVGDGEYVKVGIPITPSPKPEKSSPTGNVIDITPSGRDKSQVPETSPAPISQPIQEQKPLTELKVTSTVTPSKQTAPRVIEKANMPPDPFTPKVPPGRSATTPVPRETPFPQLTKGLLGRSSSPPRNKAELRPFVPVSGTRGSSSKFSESVYLSDAFRLVIGQVSNELEKLSESARSLAEYVEYQRQEKGSKSAADLSNPDDWTFADLQRIAGIVETNMKSVEAIVKQLPAIDESIQDVEKSLKKLEAKKLELNRFVQAVKDPEVRESIYSRKLAPDFARQQKETRHALQVAEEKFKELASALTIVKADLADDKGSFGVHSPSTAGIYRVVNNVFSRLQILSAKVIALEKKVPSSKGIRVSTPGAESPISRSSVPPTTPVTRIGGSRASPSRSSEIRTPGMNSSPGMRGSPFRKTMLDEKLDPWETEEIIRDLGKKQEFRKKIGMVLQGITPLFTEARM